MNECGMEWHVRKWNLSDFQVLLRPELLIKLLLAVAHGRDLLIPFITLLHSQLNENSLFIYFECLYKGILQCLK